MNKVINVALNKEAKAAIEISKITGLGNEFDGNINWPLFFQYLISNRMLSLFWKNSNHMLIKQAMPKYISTVARSMYISTKYRNEIYFSELNKILQLCKENQITCVPVKGARLIPLLYKDYGSRFMGDVDCLISQESFSAINDIMISLGYIQGKFDKDLQKIIPINRAEKLKWKLNMSNYYPYLKECDSEHMRIIKIDFRYSLDDTLSTSSMKEIIDHVFKAGEMKKAHTLVHLCTHLYDESKHSMSLYIGKDVNLIKYVDIREFILQIMTEEDLVEAVQFCLKYKLEKQLYYVLHHLELIYNDGYEEKYLDMLGIKDTAFLNTYGDNTLNDNKVWKKTFFQRMFSGNNSDELDETPKYFVEI